MNSYCSVFVKNEVVTLLYSQWLWICVFYYSINKTATYLPVICCKCAKQMLCLVRSFSPSLERGIVFCGSAFCCDRCRNGCSLLHSLVLAKARAKCVLSLERKRSEGGFFPGKILPQSCTCLSKTVAAALASCPYHRQLHCTREQSCGLQVTF